MSEVGRKRTTKKTKKIWSPFIYRVNILACPESQGIELGNLTLLSIDMKTKVVQHDNYHDDYYDYHDNYHDDYHNENHDYRDDYHDAWTLNLSHLVHLWKHCFPCFISLLASLTYPELCVPIVSAVSLCASCRYENEVTMYWRWHFMIDQPSLFPHPLYIAWVTIVCQTVV